MVNSPHCPECDSSNTRVVGRFTSQEEDIVRLRVCGACGHRWKTLQAPEQVLDPSIRVVFSRWTSPAGRERRVTLEYASNTR